MRDINDDTIRQKAYEFWKNRGCQDGTALEDWLAAEWTLRYSKRKNGIQELCRKYGLREYAYGLKELAASESA